jgi:hypothetical protein
MKNIIFILCIVVVCFSCSEKNDAKVADGWTILFDGSDYNQWRGFQKEEVPEEWAIVDKAMAYVPSNQGGKTILTKNQYTNFILSLEWKIGEFGNSGIFWGVSNDEKYSVAYQTGLEVQIRDNEFAKDTLVLPKHRAGAIFDVIAPAKDVVKPIGEWNTCVIQVDHDANRAVVTMNETQILDFPLHGKEWDEILSQSKFKDWEGFGEYKTGYIGLQDHGNNVWYRNIKIKEL